jgi:hypothetical protein
MFVRRVPRFATVARSLLSKRRFASGAPSSYPQTLPPALERSQGLSSVSRRPALKSALPRLSGRELEELKALEAGDERFEQGPIVGAFGTLANPTPIYSAHPPRVVGCVGKL